ncbi:MAG TPA: thioredoxin domain-containing protein [Pyrinomonadaceae bacterium]|jgi:protein-disulfide isomerase|nr:thioredoxin domain-containing protein [Pyrinomonadaceae bacterium]
MKLFLFIVFSLLALTQFASAQKPDDILATAGMRAIRFRDLSPDTQKLVGEVPARTKKLRSDLLGRMMNERLLAAEAKATGSTPAKLVAAERAKVKDPSESEIKAVYDANTNAFASISPEIARRTIVEYLRGEPEDAALISFLDNLGKKYRASEGKDINAAVLAPTDVVATVAGQPITAKEFDQYARLELWGAKADIADLISDELREAIYQTLLADEAKALGVSASDIIAREVTNKLKDFTDQERIGFEDALAKKLYAKYPVRVLYKVPEPIIENVSAATSPAKGPVTAPVTVLMFSDFQCPACSATHPILKTVMDRYPGKIRFVVRNYPLMSRHENAWNAALAAAAANRQGKFFEYIEILYTHQLVLDVESLKKYAADIGLNAAQFELDFKSDAVAAEVRKDIADGESYHLSSTPTIFVNGARVRNYSAEGFKTAIDRALGK